MDGNSQMTDPYDMNNWAVGTFKKKQRREKKLKFNIKILVKVRFYFNGPTLCTYCDEFVIFTL